MRQHISFRPIIAAIVLLLLIAQIFTWDSLRQANRQIKDLQAADQLTLNEVDGVAQAHALTPLPGTNRLYLPELNITVPLTPTTSALRYNFTEGATSTDKGEVRLTSAYMTDHAVHIQSCADMVRLKIEPQPNAYSPDQPVYASIKLSDNSVLQVYASTTKECQTAWRTVSPQTLAEAFRNAAIY